MPSIHVEALIDAAPDKVWEVVGDWENGPVRMAPGFVVSSVVDGDARVVTFANGAVARERFVTRDEGRRRLVGTSSADPRCTTTASCRCTTPPPARPA